MDASGVSVLLYRTSKPQGKVRRRVQDLRIPASSSYDFIASRPALDLSHNESARLAVDSMLSRGLEGYHEVLEAEGEVDFLSELEKLYIQENGRDGSTADPGASDDSDNEFKSLSAGSQSATHCPSVSLDSDPTVAGLDQSFQKGSDPVLAGLDLKQTDAVLNEQRIKVYFQADGRAASMKDLVREFIRKAGMVLAIVIDSFSDVELLCDLLEASRKRNVSIHLLLDHLNLNLFVSMWQDLKLDSKNFPKLSVRSVDGHTYCAKTGRKLTGQIAESFIITDWKEVLTGSYSFSWLSWQVHRSLAVLVNGHLVIPFHQEFLRLYSSSKPVPGFVTFIPAPQTIPLYTSHAAQNANTDARKSKSSPIKTMCHKALHKDSKNTQINPKMPVSSNPQSAELECSGDNTQPLHRAGTGAKMNEKPAELNPKHLVQPQTLRSVSAGTPQHIMRTVCPQSGAQTYGEPLEKKTIQIQKHSNYLSQTHVSYVQSQQTVTATENNVRAQESTPLHTASPSHGQHSLVSYQSPFKTNPEHPNGDTEGLFFQLRNRNRLTEIVSGQDTQRRQWNGSFSYKPKGDFLSDNHTSLQKQAKSGFRFHLSHQGGLTPGPQIKVPHLGTKRQDHPQRHNQSSLQAHQTTEGPGSKSSAMAVHLKPQLQLGSRLGLQGKGGKLHLQPHSSHQARPPPGLNWTPQSRTERPRPLARHSSFNATYRTGQKLDGQAGWRPLLERSKSMTDRCSAGLHPNITKT